MIVSEYIADFLAKKGIKDVFFIEVSACASLIVAVARNKKLTYRCPLHEQAGAFAADGYYIDFNSKRGDLIVDPDCKLHFYSKSTVVRIEYKPKTGFFWGKKDKPFPDFI